MSASQAVQREQQHKLAKNVLLQGDYLRAASLLQEARKTYGDHVSLLSDLTTCYYMKGRIIEWKHYLDLTAQTYTQVRSFLRPDNRFAVGMILGKFREEEAKLAEAVQIYESCLAELQIERDGEYYYLFMAQLLRLAAQFGVNVPASEYYSILSRLAHIEENTLDRIDILHALMLADLYFSGEQTAIARLQQILDLPGIRPFEQNLAYYDLLEAFLRKSGKVPERLVAQAEAFAPIDPYEKLLRKMVCGDVASNAALELTPGLSTAGLLRLASLLFPFARGMERKIELRRKVVLLLSGLSSNSEALWRRHLHRMLTESGVRVLIDRKQPRLRVGDSVLDLQRKRSMLLLLRNLAGHRERSIEMVCKDVWDAGYNESYYHRIRMLARRLNDLIYTNFGIERAVTVSVEAVTLSAAVQLELE